MHKQGLPVPEAEKKRGAGLFLETREDAGRREGSGKESGQRKKKGRNDRWEETGDGG